MLLQMKTKQLEALTNKSDHKSIYIEIFDKLVKGKTNGRKELKYKIDHDNFMYCFKADTVKKKL